MKIKKFFPITIFMNFIFLFFISTIFSATNEGTKKWSFETGDSIKSSPAVGLDGTVYIGSENGRLYAIKHDGTMRWEFQTETGVTCFPAIGQMAQYI